MGKRLTPAEEVEALREATREAHEAMKDARLVVREMHDVEQRLRETADRVFGERIETQVAAGLAQYRESIDTAIETATDAVYKRFDTIADLMLGESREQRRNGETPLVEHARRIGDGRETHGGA